MKFKDITKEDLRICFNCVENYLSTQEQKWVKYIDLGCKVVRLISYSDEFLPLVQKQLTFALKDRAENFDATLVIWNEKDMISLSKKVISSNPKYNMRFRLEQTLLKAKKDTITDPNIVYNVDFIYNNFSKTKPAVSIQTTRGFFMGNDSEKNTYYYGVNDLDPEEFIKEGHIFVQFFNNILKTETSNLVHGAVIGLNNNGILFCARGQRGKSTLSVLSMMKGFEYVSDDYLILHEKDGQLLSSPIYSIITLSPVMYNRLYEYMNGSQFVSNNARKDKYVFNISNYHPQFKTNYPIKICIFPEIVSDKEPSIRLCTPEEKGRAMVQAIQSTLMQTQDLSENWTVKKMMNMIKDFDYYKLNLCWDIDKNTEFLRDFMNSLDKQNPKPVASEKIAVDITFDLANILNTETGIIYSMNKFATNLYENLLQGVSKESISAELTKLREKNNNLVKEFDLLIEALESKKLFTQTTATNKMPEINMEFAEENNYKLSFTEHAEEEYRELIKENKENKNELCIK